ncbi:hypothetical protein RJ639_002549 [Escallonia herrerae]|uniref:Vinorine synthase-like n=1 Tax=Escallonia herrerae TaxID=1293975 RepID=A0AA89BTJ5_9ASTE|nr:hypothetical protein RJ639_002549 [Escallonia herrerae]
MKVDIISRELIKPSSPTPSDLKNMELSFIDQRIPPSYVPLLIYFLYNETSNITQSAMSDRLKGSLSDALTLFYPLAGRMEGQSSVNCSDEGASYLEARVDGQISTIIECAEVQVLDLFVPYKLNGIGFDVEEQLAIQVNLFNCGGIAIGICLSHRIGDACTFCTFIKGWAAIACKDSNSVGPIFNSASLFPPVHSSEYKPDIRSPAIQPPVERLVTKRFVFTSSAIAELKAKVVSSGSVIRPTRVEVVTALIWKCGIAAAGINERKSSVAAFHPVNLRGRMAPPLPECSFGNIFQMATAAAEGETELGFLVAKLRAAFEKMDSRFTRELLGENGVQVVNNNFKEIGKLLSQGNARVFRFSSWCGFPTYEADFGWGKPSWVSSTANFLIKDHIFLLESRLAGGIEAWVVMAEQDMTKFEQEPELLHFLESK